MTREDIEQLYITHKAKAMAVARTITSGAEDVAEDAVADTVVELLTAITKNPDFSATPALFIRRVKDRARDAMRPRGVDRNKKRNAAVGRDDRPRVVSVGTALDLDRFLYGPDDDDE